MSTKRVRFHYRDKFEAALAANVGREVAVYIGGAPSTYVGVAVLLRVGCAYYLASVEGAERRVFNVTDVLSIRLCAVMDEIQLA